MAAPKSVVTLQSQTAMKSDLMEIFGTQIRWFAGLSMKQRLYVLYFCFSLTLLVALSYDNLMLMSIIVLNFGNSARLIKQVPIDNLKD